MLLGDNLVVIIVLNLVVPVFDDIHKTCYGIDHHKCIVARGAKRAWLRCDPNVADPLNLIRLIPAEESALRITHHEHTPLVMIFCM
jgi:hypothetical protein